MSGDESGQRRRGRRRWVGVAAGIVTVALVAGAVGWAAATASRPAEDPLEAIQQSPTVIDVEFNASLTPWWDGREGRIDLGERFAMVPITFELVSHTGAGPWGADLTPITTVRAVPGVPGPTALIEATDPPHVPKGTHGVEVPQVASGKYYLRAATKLFRFAAPVYMGNPPGYPLDYHWSNEYPFPGCTLNGPCPQLDDYWERGGSE